MRRGRRRAVSLAAALVMLGAWQQVVPTTHVLAEPFTASPFFQRSSSEEKKVAAFSLFTDDVVASLKYDRILGTGTYKTVYAVSSPLLAGKWALAVERLEDSVSLGEELHAITVAQDLHASLPENERELFEQVESWWLQSATVLKFEPGI